MVDLTLIEKKYGCTPERLKAVFTAREPADIMNRPQEEQDRIRATVAARKRLEEKIESRISDGLTRNLQNHAIYSAVDLAWDSTPINRGTVPLMLYAQGKLPLSDCAVSLEKAGFGKYVQKNVKGKVVDVNIPRFLEVNVNLIRSVLTRRLAAQSNKYANLWPYYKYEARGTALAAKLKADALSQVVDIMCDQYNYRHQEVQAIRDTLLYGHCVEFVRCAWEKEQQERTKRAAPGLETSEPETVVMTTKEGVCFVNPHPSRVSWDNAYPLTSLNTDTGTEWIFFWDVKRYKDVNLNPAYWNKDRVGYSQATVSLFSTYASYFSQYYCTITKPSGPFGSSGDLTSHNDRLSNLATYSSDRGDEALVETNMFWKLIPKDWGLGEYMHPVWLRIICGGENTVMFAEWLPSSPGAVTSYNENDSRQLNISFAHELMGYQDQMTNLLSYLLLCLQADHIKVIIVDTGVAGPEQIKAFREQVKGNNAWTGTTILEIDRQKMTELGVSSPDQIVKMIETKDSAVEMIFRAIGMLTQFVERMAALSPQEQGQPAPREISATETNLIAGTTESVYGFISDSIDEARAAKKRIVYESYMIFGDPTFHVPVINRYPRSVIEAAGLNPTEGEELPNQIPMMPNKAQRFTVSGPKDRLEHDYIFSSRDGAERPSNTQAANTLVQLLSTVMSIPAVASKVTTEQIFGVVNEVFRQSGAGHDLNLELQPGAENEPGPNPEDIQGVLEGLVKATEQNAAQLAALTGGGGGAPPPGGDPGMAPPPGMPPGMPPPEMMPPPTAVAA